MSTTTKEVALLFEKLTASNRHMFPKPRATLDAPISHGVYVIYSPGGDVLHVGRSVTGKEGLHQRLNDHLRNCSSFTRMFLKGDGSILRDEYYFRYIKVPDDKIRAYLEAYAIGHLCPKHIGTGIRKNQKT